MKAHEFSSHEIRKEGPSLSVEFVQRVLEPKVEVCPQEGQVDELFKNATREDLIAVVQDLRVRLHVTSQRNLALTAASQSHFTMTADAARRMLFEHEDDCNRMEAAAIVIENSAAEREGVTKHLAWLIERVEWLKREMDNGGNWEYLRLKREETMYCLDKLRQHIPRTEGNAIVMHRGAVVTKRSAIGQMLVEAKQPAEVVDFYDIRSKAYALANLNRQKPWARRYLRSRRYV